MGVQRALVAHVREQLLGGLLGQHLPDEVRLRRERAFALLER